MVARPTRRRLQARMERSPAPEPGDVALEFLTKAAPLHSPEWAAWRARIRAPRITGKWLVSATITGHGKYVGEMLIEPGAAEDEFKTSVTMKSIQDGSTITRSGTGLVYAGYSWRGRSKGTTAPSSKPDDLLSEAREALWISPDQSSAEGRWFWGEYQEFGFDVKLERASHGPDIDQRRFLRAEGRVKGCAASNPGRQFAGRSRSSRSGSGSGRKGDSRLSRIVRRS